jgi:hypothetical protein
METTASEQSAPAAKGKSAQQRSWRIPTPVVLTIVGLVLSAWLLPAITRQWDDRQKAHDLQASLIEDMSAANARALVAAQNAFETKQAVSQPASKAEQDWQVSSHEVEAKLRPYFSRQVAQAWGNYERFMQLALFEAFHRALVPVDAVPFDPRAFKRLEQGLGTRESRYEAFRWNSVHLAAWHAVGKQLRLAEAHAESAVLAAHVKGYSTSWRDLLNDLVP